VLLAAVVAIHHWLTHVGPLPGDRWAADHFEPWQVASQPRSLRSFDSLFNWLGSPLPAIALAMLTIAGLLRGGDRDEIAGLVIAACAIAANSVLKSAWGPTPLWLESGRGGVNFPSGHTAFAAAMIGYLALLAYRHHHPCWGTVVVLIALCMGPTRVVSGSHLPSDVVAGYLQGGAWLLAAAAWLEVSRVTRATTRRPSMTV
jgi:undecaprenyl-diphosphatase